MVTDEAEGVPRRRIRPLSEHGPTVGSPNHDPTQTSVNKKTRIKPNEGRGQKINGAE